MVFTKALFLLCALASASAQEVTTVSTLFVPPPTAVIHLNPPAQQTDPSYTSDSDFQSQMIYAHNWFRAEHSASDLTWNDSCAASSQAYANKCIWKHSGDPGVGENLDLGYSSVITSVNGWGLERTQYDWSNPGFSEATGHFTQLVWKATTSVGCGRTNCPGENNLPNNPDYFVVCQYYPPGNIVNPGFFAENVGELVSGSLSVGIPAESQPTTGSDSGGSNPNQGSAGNENEAQKSGCEPMKNGKNNILKIVSALLTAGTPLIFFERDCVR